MSVNEEKRFPLYRKIGNKSYYKILSPKEIIELQIIGSKIVEHKINSNQYLNALFIKDLIDNYEGRYEVSTEMEFEKLLIESGA